MHLDINNIQELLKEKDLKVTPQRIGVLEAIYSLRNHPTAEQIIDFIHKKHPSIAIGTVYKTLETFVKYGVVNKVMTEGGVMRYDGILKHHHHLHSEDSNEIRDYINEELDEILKAYFEKNAIEGYQVNSITLHISGKSIH
ncbi:Fur family transcriptional regulator [Petrimonas sp.]|uniref:Fur family transcriptional regulator n=1 Tax=Petrimonas sp. TaxID=2023866 RepID=UPI003F518049